MTSLYRITSQAGGEGGAVVKEDILTENAQLKCEMKLPIGIAKFSQQTHEMSFFLDSLPHFLNFLIMMFSAVGKS